MDAASLLTGLLLGALLATAVTLGVVALLARRRPEERRARAGARVARPPAPAARRHGARPRHRARRAARADGHGRPDLGPAQARDGGAGHRAAHAARARALGRGAAAPGGRGGRACWSTATSSSSRPATNDAGRRRPARPGRHPRRRPPGDRRRQGAVHRLHRGRAGHRPGGARPAGADARPPAARPRRRAGRPPLPDRVPARRRRSPCCSCPSDGFLTTALEAEPGLLEYGFARDVVLATPSTLLALLRTVAYSWRQERLARDADQVLEVGRLLHARLEHAVRATSPGSARRSARR